jgi:hypothetical protein
MTFTFPRKGIVHPAMIEHIENLLLPLSKSRGYLEFLQSDVVFPMAILAICALCIGATIVGSAIGSIGGGE